MDALEEAMSGRRRPLIIYQAPWNWDGLWNRSQPLAQALSAYGTVIYLNCGTETNGPLPRLLARVPKLRSWVSARYHWSRVESISASLMVWHWHAPVAEEWYVVRRDRPKWSYCDLIKAIRGLAAEHDEVWLLTSRPMAQRLQTIWPWNRVLVDIEDPWLSLAWGKSVSRRVVTDLLRNADRVFANGPKLSVEYAEIAGRGVVSLPNGIDQSFISKISTDLALPEVFRTEGVSCRAVYTGNFNDRIDLDYMLRIANECLEVSFCIVGHVRPDQSQRDKMQLFRSLPNVQIVPPVPHGDIPAILRHADVLLLPYAHGGSQTMFPAKLYEYCAAGKPILSTMDFGLGAEAPKSLTVRQNPSDAVAFLRRLGADPCVSMCGESGVELAKLNTWDSRASAFFNAVWGNG